MSSTFAIVKTNVSLPSYLKHFESDYDRVNIIYSKKPSISSQNDDSSSPVLENSTLENSLQESDLTGDPLKVDLGNDDSIQMIKIDEVLHSWTKDESKHFPLLIKDAKNQLNKVLKNSGSCESENVFPTYVVCSDNASNPTIVIGGDRKNHAGCIIEVLDIIQKNDLSVELNKMIEYHLKKYNVDLAKTSYVTNMKYNIYGNQTFKNLSCQSASMRNFDYHANVNVDVSCNECISCANEGKNINITMNLEMIAGHRLLTLNYLFEEVCVLQNYLDILLSVTTINGETILCNDPLETDEILRKIEKLVATRFLRNPSVESVDPKNIRNGDFLDELWNILKYCENITVLRDSFHFLFEEIIETNNRSVMIKDLTSYIAQLIDGILNGKLILSAITLKQAVELLFELGAYKLKNDFQAIFKLSSSNIRTNVIDTVWKGFVQKPTVESSNTRATRVTQSLQHSQLDIKIKQLAYLGQLYVGAEFICLIRDQVPLNEDTFYSLCDNIEKEYIINSSKFIDFLEIYQTPLCELSFSLDSKNLTVIGGIMPTNWSMQVNSKYNDMTLTTSYVLADFPIFPPCIYDDDIPAMDKEKMFYYVFRMSKIRGLF
ncbi:uncharacterized protein LOC115883946 [Sitophilus oryzae]|uniref:Protein zwilch n=1 Tax=Sitophilus oryzae TaxID=7048 RepID=A0A6J2Y3G0_SITOR|nr:uncharacterized protein LOC115883946 [Sitophilus oryzae]